ncbi:MAG: WXG100 family type VII secretion target [Mycobacteriaceae bacterium]
MTTGASDDVFSTDTAVVIDAAVRAKQQADQMDEELARIDRRIDDLMCSWRGAAAKSYRDNWNDLKEILCKQIRDLQEMGEQLGASTQTFVQVEEANTTTYGVLNW